MLRIALSLLLLACLGKPHAQNLLANGHFDDRNICLEFRSGCAPEAWFRVPLAPVAVSGETHNQYVSLVMENIFNPFAGRSLIYTRVLCNLTRGKKYQFKAWLRGDNISFDHMDVMMVPFEPNRNKQRLASEKQKFTITNEQKLQNRPDGWVEYFFAFTAKGNERYLILGNFSKQPLVVKEVLEDGSGNARYDIDNVSLFPEDSTEVACPEWQRNKIVLYQNNSRHTPNNFLDDEEPYIPAPEEPIIPPVAAPVRNDTLIIPDLLFKSNSSELNPQFTGRLDTLVNKIKTRSFKSIEVIGHTDSLGTNTINQSLSLRRAETVKNYLVAKLQYPTASITTNGKAATAPIASNKTAAGRQKNRRVEIILGR